MQARGYEIVDYALPQGWVDEVREKFGLDVVPHFVWCYDLVTFEVPAPITETGDEMDLFLTRKGYHAVTYADLRKLADK